MAGKDGAESEGRYRIGGEEKLAGRMQIAWEKRVAKNGRRCESSAKHGRILGAVAGYAYIFKLNYTPYQTR